MFNIEWPVCWESEYFFFSHSLMSIYNNIIFLKETSRIHKLWKSMHVCLTKQNLYLNPQQTRYLIQSSQLQTNWPTELMSQRLNMKTGEEPRGKTKCAILHPNLFHHQGHRNYLQEKIVGMPRCLTADFSFCSFSLFSHWFPNASVPRIFLHKAAYREPCRPHFKSLYLETLFTWIFKNGFEQPVFLLC